MDRTGPDFAKPLTAPAPWLPLAAEQAAGRGPGPGREHPFPGPGWPPLEAIDYLSKLIVLGVLLLALPWLVGKLLTHPGKVPAELGEHLLGGD